MGEVIVIPLSQDRIAVIILALLFLLGLARVVREALR